MKWSNPDDAPYYKVLRAKDDLGGVYYAERKARSCTGMCVPRRQKIHTKHFHDEWVIVTLDGEELHVIEGYTTIHPTGWKYVGDVDE
tara:strand:+ start:3348 stop:3608 length:261 start_codon:yes stop_codon:yes gene_type:complete